MTKKEKLYLTYLQYTNLTIQTYPERGNDKPINFESAMDNFNPREYNIANLEWMVDNAKDKYEKALLNKKREDYFNTPKGAERKEFLESEIQKAENEAEKLINEAEINIQRKLDIMFSYPFLSVKVRSFCASSFRINMVDEDGNDMFGHNVEIRRNFDDTEYTINYGTMGSFSPNKDLSRVNLIKMIAKILDEFSIIESIMDELNEKLNVIQKKHAVLKKELSNPFIEL